MKGRSKRTLAVVLSFAMALGMLSPGQIEAMAATKGKVKKVTLNYTQYVLKKGQKVKLKAVVSPKNAKSAKLKWASTNAKKVSVNSKGVVKAKAKKGKATITVTAGKKKAYCKIIIGKPVKKIVAEDMTINVGETKKIETLLSPAKPSISKLKYESSDGKKVQVSTKGEVTGLEEGSAQITITATDCMKVKKKITVTVQKAADSTPGATAPGAVTQNPQTTTSAPASGSATENPKESPGVSKEPSETETPEATPEFSIKLDKEEVSLSLGESWTPELSFVPDTVSNQNVNWSVSDSSIASVNTETGEITALTPGECEVKAVAKKDDRVSAVCKVTVSDKDVSSKTVSTEDGLIEALKENTGVVTLKTTAKSITIPEGDYSESVLIVDAPDAHIENKATYKYIVIKDIATDTWKEYSANTMYITDGNGSHLYVTNKATADITLLDGADSVKITNDGDIKNLLIESAAKVLIKGDSVATKVPCVNRGGGRVTAYVPLDIYSTTTYKLVIGPNGEQTAVRVDKESSIPEISGLGTISITIDSTGEERSVTAEYDDSIDGLPVISSLTGKVVDEEGEGKEATVYLVGYSKLMDGDNISVYLNGSTTKEITTDENGVYSFADVKAGNYVIVVEAEGYQLITQMISVPVSYKGSSYTVDDILLLEDASKPGTISGVLNDAATGLALTKQLTVILRKGMNNITSNATQTVLSDSEGNYKFENVTPGQYTIQVVDKNTLEEYVSTYVNISVLSDAEVTKSIVVSKRIASSEVRFVLTWDGEAEGVSEDLDIYLYGPNTYDGGEFEIHYDTTTDYENSQTFSSYNLKDGVYAERANLDVDDKEYEGPETITLENILPGNYKIFVKDYSNSGAGSGLMKSHPVINVYSGGEVKETIKMSEQKGGIWFACVYDSETGKVTPVDEAYSGQPNTTTKAKLIAALNELQQFEITDISAFAKDQVVLDKVLANYLQEKDEEILAGYLEDVQEIVEKLKNGLQIENVYLDEVEGSAVDYGQHYTQLYFSKKGTEEEILLQFSKNANNTYQIEKSEEEVRGSSYKLIITNPDIGASTSYYYCIEYIGRTSWIKSVKAPEGVLCKYELYFDSGYVGGETESISEDLTYVLEDNVELVSVEYPEDDVREENGTYVSQGDVVLHLKDSITGEEISYDIWYKTLNVNFYGITDEANEILSFSRLNSNLDWWEYGSYHYTTIEVCGKNASLGETWKPVLDEGATYEVTYPNVGGNIAYVTITNAKGAKVQYTLNYYQDDSDAELLKVYDPGNIITSYQVSSASVGSYNNVKYYNINMSGRNSELGQDLKVSVYSGASVKIEYTTGAGSSSTSDACITVTSASGAKRIYYIIYNKTSEDIPIKKISSDTNELYVEYDDGYFSIKGENQTLGDDINIETVEGYSVERDGNWIVVTSEDSGEENDYYMSYSQYVQYKTYSNALKAITSTQDTRLKVEINEGEDIVELTGQFASCPTDLKPILIGDGTAEVIYSDDSENAWDAKINIIDAEDEVYGVYYVYYKQDDSAASILQINAKNTDYLGTHISSERYSLSTEDDTYENVYIIHVLGDESELAEYHLILNDGAEITSTIHAGEEQWNYSVDSREAGRIDSGNTNISMSDREYLFIDRVEVTAANGAKRVYVIAYAQDDSGAEIKNVTDENNEYFEVYKSSDSAFGDDLTEVNIIGQNAELGSSYQLDIPEGAQITKKIHYGEEGWTFSDIKNEVLWYEDDNNNGREVLATDAVYVEITAENGAVLKYILLYAQDDSAVSVTNLLDDSNTYYNIEIEDTYSTVKTSEVDADGDAIWKQVSMIYVYGKNATLGTDYQLEMAEGNRVVSTVHSTDASWKYVADSVNHSVKEGDEWTSRTYFYTDEITVEAENGAQRRYLVVYAPDMSSFGINGINDDNNEYTSVDISTETKYMSFVNEDGEYESEEVYPIYVYGGKEELGTDYVIDVDDDCTLGDVVHVTDSEWKYTSKSCEYNDIKYDYASAVTVTSTSGLEKKYVIAYAQDVTGAQIQGIMDENNQVVSINYGVGKLDTTELDSEGDNIYESVNIIYALGDSSDLGEDYTLQLPEGSSTTVIHNSDTLWNYLYDTIEYGYWDDELGKSIYNTYMLIDKVTVTAKNGAQMVYVIAYAQDNRGAIVNSISDEKNNYIYTAFEDDQLSITEKDSSGNVVYESVKMIYVLGDNSELGDTYVLDISEESSSTVVSNTDDIWNYTAKTHSFGRWDNEVDGYIYTTYTLTDKVTVTAKNGVQQVYVIAYCQDDSGTKVSGISDENNNYIDTNIESKQLKTTEKDSDGNAVYESVKIIYVLGDNDGLGDTYVLDISKGSSTTVVHSGDEGWKYEDETSKLGIWDNELEETIYTTYTLIDKVTVTAKNGAQKVYVIAYRQENSGAIVTSISDENNSYVNTYFSDAVELKTTETDSKGNAVYESVEIIYVMGENSELGDSYILTAPEGSKTEVIHNNDSGWKYVDETKNYSFWDDDSGERLRNSYILTDRVTVIAANGAKKIYVIAYVQDNREVTINDISDDNNTYVHTEVYSAELKTTNMDGDGNVIYDPVEIVYILGENSQLGTSYALDMPEGSSVTVIHNSDTEWKYAEETMVYDFWDAESEEYVYNTYTLVDKIIVTASNGAQKVYVIAYAQDNRDLTISISDENNAYAFTEYSNKELEITENNSDDASYELVEMIYVLGDNSQLGDSYTLSIPEDSSTDTVHNNDSAWKYVDKTLGYTFWDEELKKNIYNTYTLMDKVTVTASNGAQKVYVIAYAQDNRGTIVSGISDETNKYISTKLSSANVKTNEKDNDGNAIYESVEMIYVVGEKTELGDTYQLNIPEDSRTTVIHNNDSTWKYANEKLNYSYYDNEFSRSIYTTCTLIDEVTVTASNGAQKIYLIAYAQDTRIKGIYDENNVYEGTDFSSKELKTTENTSDGEVIYESVEMIYVLGKNLQLGDSYTLNIPEGSKTSVIHSGDETWNYTNKTIGHGLYDNSGEYIYHEYTLMDKVILTMSDGIEKIYVIAYAQDVRITNISDDNNVYEAINTLSKDLKTTENDSEGEAVYESVELIYILGDSAKLGNSYTFDIPEGSNVSVIHNSDEAWNYTDEAIEYGFYDESDEYLKYKYFLMDKITLTATDGTEIVYVIAYAQDIRIEDIRDENNTYISTRFESKKLKTTEYDSDGDLVYESVEMIYILGNNSELGGEYVLDTPEGSDISVIHNSDEAWKYKDITIQYGFYDESNKRITKYYTLTDRITVTTSTGEQNIYVIAYCQDDSGTVVSGISDNQNKYFYTTFESKSLCTTEYADDEDYVYESVEMIYVVGNNGDLGETYELDIPEGSNISIIHNNDEEWNYKDETVNDSFYNESDEYVYYTYTLMDKVIVTASNGAKKIYVVAYVQDDSGAKINDISDENNTYINAVISGSKELQTIESDDSGNTIYESVKMIYVIGDNNELGQTYELDVPEGSSVSTVHNSDTEWNYTDETVKHGFYDEEDDYIYKTYTLIDRVTVIASNGAKKVYVIAYCQDDSGAEVSGISDTNNTYISWGKSDNALIQIKDGEEYRYESVRVIYVVGDNNQLGNSYKLEAPEGSSISTIHNTDEEWKYVTETIYYSYYVDSDQYVSCSCTLVDEVTVTASNGAQSVYVVAYCQDASGTVINTISDENNTYAFSKISAGSQLRITDDEGNISYTFVEMIYIRGENSELGESYQLEIHEESSFSIIHATDAEWNYVDEEVNYSCYDDSGQYVSDTYALVDEVTVTAANGTQKVYVIAYASTEE